MIKNTQTMGMGGVSIALSQRDVTKFVSSQKFCDVSGPQFDTSIDVDTVGFFQKFFEKTLVHLKEDSTTYVRKQTATSFTPFALTKRVRKWKVKAVNRMHTVLALSKFFYSPTDVQVNCRKTILKFTLKLTLKQLRHVSVQSHHHHEAYYSCLLKLQLLK